MSLALDPRLAADTHPIGDLRLSRLLLMDDARFPWLILVPRIAGAREWFDLDGNDRTLSMDEVALVGRAMEALFQPDKLNIAALGNAVPQLHIHIVARRHDDAAWPQPVWGCGERVPYTDEECQRLVFAVRRALELPDLG